ncbi:MAG: hypothetical protein NC911_06695, partial [Candidatus Omnitrophica bacterium]|nr:hypothetical protein [Candidatus Omnitrophota bacterium]
MKSCVHSLASTRAEWFLSLLIGETSIVQSCLPRKPDQIEKSYSSLSVTLPPLKRTEKEVIQEGEKILLRCFDPKVNLLRDVPATASSGQANLAIDGDKNTFWQPDSLPGVLIVSLPQPASIQRLVIRLVEYSYFTVSFLDFTGKVLSRYERDWNFWEHMQSKNLYPPLVVTLNLLPVAGVAYIRLEMSKNLGKLSGVAELEAYASPFPAQGEWIEEIPLLPATKSVVLNWETENVVKEVIYTGEMESFRGFPVVRWQSPWLRRQTVSLRQIGGAAGLEFFGRNATLLVSGIGKVKWQLDTGENGVIEHPEKEKTEHPLAHKLPPGRHYLWLENEAFPAKEDTYGAGDCQISGLKVMGETEVSVLVRFGDGKEWGGWLGPIQPGQNVAVTYIPGREKKICQVKVKLDTRAVIGQATPVMKNLKIRAQAEEGHNWPVSQERENIFFRDSLEEVAEVVNRREVMVVYPKTGTKEEYEIARQIAEKVGVYLVSDDIGLNLYPALVLAVGTPQNHRYCRQLIAWAGVWSDPDFLNSKAGLVGRSRSDKERTNWLFVTGENPEAVVSAGKRLLTRLKTYQPEEKPFRFFPADTLEVVYPWQSHLEREKLENLTVTLGKNDRRNIQLGLSASQNLSSLTFRCSELVSASGESLPQPITRVVGWYEWEPFFGQLRLPNFLIKGPISLPANTATGIWLTVQTRKETIPGIYQGKLTVSGGNHTETIPVKVTVLPITLADFSRTKTMSFAAVPWFFPRGSADWKKAVRTLAENEAEHGANVFSLPMTIDWKCQEGKVPIKQAIVKTGTTEESISWSAYAPGNKKVPPDFQLMVELDCPMKVKQVAVAAKIANPEGLTCEVLLPDGPWKKLPSLSWDEGGSPFEEKQAEEPSWLGFFFAGPAEIVNRVRFRGNGKIELEIGTIAIFSEELNRYPFTIDFSLIQSQMEIVEAVCGG